MNNNDSFVMMQIEIIRKEIACGKYTDAEIITHILKRFERIEKEIKTED